MMMMASSAEEINETARSMADNNNVEWVGIMKGTHLINKLYSSPPVLSYFKALKAMAVEQAEARKLEPGWREGRAA